MTRVRIRYTDGGEREFSPSQWPRMRAIGVDSVWLGSEDGWTRMDGHSLYWCYREGDDWVFGAGPVGYGPLSPEVVMPGHRARKIEYMPDLPRLSCIKLGHWRP